MSDHESLNTKHIIFTAKIKMTFYIPNLKNYVLPLGICRQKDNAMLCKRSKYNLLLSSTLSSSAIIVHSNKKLILYEHKIFLNIILIS